MWGLSTNPKKYEICTASDDKTVRIWSLTDRRMIRSKTFDKLLRSCEYSQNGNRIAVGTKDGLIGFLEKNFVLFNLILGQVMILNEADLNVLVPIQHRNREVSDVKFSPGEICFKIIFIKILVFFI